MRELIEKYRWADTEDLAWTIAVVKGASLEATVGVYGGDPARPIGSFTFAEAGVPPADFGKYFHLQVHVGDDCVVAIENNGWTGNVPETARRLSLGGRHFFSVYRSPAASGILEAIDGEVTAWFDPVLFDPDARFDVNPSWVKVADLDIGSINAASLAYLEQRTGVGVERAWLGERLPTYRIPDPDVMLRDVPGARVP